MCWPRSQYTPLDKHSLEFQVCVSCLCLPTCLDVVHTCATGWRGLHCCAEHRRSCVQVWFSFTGVISKLRSRARRVSSDTCQSRLTLAPVTVHACRVMSLYGRSRVLRSCRPSRHTVGSTCCTYMWAHKAWHWTPSLQVNLQYM